MSGIEHLACDRCGLPYADCGCTASRETEAEKKAKVEEIQGVFRQQRAGVPSVLRDHDKYRETIEITVTFATSIHLGIEDLARREKLSYPAAFRKALRSYGDEKRMWTMIGADVQKTITVAVHEYERFKTAKKESDKPLSQLVEERLARGLTALEKKR